MDNILEYRCPGCDKNLDPRDAIDSVLECPYCGNHITLPRRQASDDALSYLKAGAKHLDLGQFQEAFVMYQKAAEEDKKEPEAYFGMALARAQVQYLKDYREKPHLQPICFEISEKKFSENKYYLKAYELATEEQKKVYKEKAKEIDDIRNKFVELRKTQPPYDCFICTKVSTIDDPKQKFTDDSKFASEIYHSLKDLGFHPFYSEAEVNGRVGVDYEALILYALYSSTCMIIVCTDEEYLQTPWVRNEYMRYIKLLSEHKKKNESIAIAFRDEPIEHLPTYQGTIQGVNLKDYRGSKFIENFVRKFSLDRSSFTLQEDHIEHQERKLIEKPKHNLVETELSFNSNNRGVVQLNVGRRLDQVNDDLRMSHIASARERLDRIKDDNPNWASNGQILTYDLIVRNNIKGLDEFQKPTNIEKLFDVDLFSRILKNSTQGWSYFIVDILYNCVINSHDSAKRANILDFIISYQYPKKNEFLLKILQRAENEVDTTIFDLVLPWAKVDARAETINMCLNSFESGNYLAASKYANLILTDYEKGNPMAQDIYLLSKYRKDTYKELFKVMDISIIDELKEILSYLPNEFKCPYCDETYDIGTINEDKFYCHSCDSEIKLLNVKTERVNKLDEWNKDIIASLEKGFSPNFMNFYDAFLRLYPQVIQIKRVQEIVEIAKSKRAFEIASHYALVLLPSTKDKASLYWQMMLFEFGCLNEEELYTTKFFERVRGRRIDSSQYYNLAYQETVAGTKFDDYIRGVNIKQQEYFDKYVKEAEEARRRAENIRKEEEKQAAHLAKIKSQKRINRIILTILPILVFIIGQTIQFSFYHSENKIILLDWFFYDLNPIILLLSTVLGAISSIFIILSIHKLIGKYSHILDAWLLFILTSILLVAVPTVGGILLFLPSAIILGLVSKKRIAAIPTIYPFVSCIFGLGFSWLLFRFYHFIPFYEELSNLIMLPYIDTFYIMIMGSIISLASSILMAFIGYHLIYNDSHLKSFFILIPFLVIQSILAITSSIPLFIITLIIASIYHKTDESEANIPQLGLIMLALSLLFLAFIPDVPIFIVPIIALVPIICAAIYKQRAPYRFKSYIVPILIAAGWIILANLNLDLIYPKLGEIKEMTESYMLFEDYYEDVLKDVSKLMLYVSIVILIVSLIGTGKPRKLGGISVPLLAIGSYAICVLIVNQFLIQVPEYYSDDYEGNSFLFSIIGGVILAIPGVIFQVVGHAILNKIKPIARRR